MAIDNLSSFKKLIDDENNQVMKSRAQEAAANVIAQAARQGIRMSVDEAYSLPSARLQVMLNENEPVGDWFAEAEAHGLESFQRAAEERAVMEAVADAKNDRHAQAVEALETELSKLSPGERMARARELGQRLPGPGETKRQPLSPAEKAAALQELERLLAAMKMARVRELGL
ncbi:hypothetical protein ACSSNL_03175 [Thalassobius sp. S69A]|uniref:hypothetical protein n=1 Tax=unclassified Thalassovita TaxID=2619711 RepID=UPI000C3B0894|nr:hypothetical protein [Paracoccaceae bacterium]